MMQKHQIGNHTVYFWIVYIRNEYGDRGKVESFDKLCNKTVPA